MLPEALRGEYADMPAPTQQPAAVTTNALKPEA